MAHTYTRNSVEEAVALAERFRDEGRYDLFRGQRENWPVVPTFARLDEAGQDDAHEYRQAQIERHRQATVHEDKQNQYQN